MDAPLVIRPAGWTPERYVTPARDATGHRIELIRVTDERTGKVAGNSYGPTMMRRNHDDSQDAKARPEPARATISAGDFGMTPTELHELFKELEWRYPNVTDTGLILRGF
jgi:hypothetical protein